MWDLIVSVPDRCLSFYFDRNVILTSSFKTIEDPLEGHCYSQILSNFTTM